MQQTSFRTPLQQATPGATPPALASSISWHPKKQICLKLSETLSTDLERPPGQNRTFDLERAPEHLHPKKQICVKLCQTSSTDLERPPSRNGTFDLERAPEHPRRLLARAPVTLFMRIISSFYGHGRHYAMTNRNDLLEVNNATYFFSYTLEANMSWTPLRWDQAYPRASSHAMELMTISNSFEKSNAAVDYTCCQKTT